MLAALLVAGLAGCGRTPPAPQGGAQYTVGPAWQGAQGVWFYPAENFSADQTGLAAIAGDDHPARTADGEAFDQTALAAGHQTLQLPAIARVTNLDNGREVLVRVNDRGPASPGRLIELTRRAAALLAIKAGDPVRLQVQGGPSLLLAEQLQAGQPGLQKIDAAPLAPVLASELAPPAGVSLSARGHRVAGAPVATRDAAVAETVALRLPEQVVQGTPFHGHLLIRAGDFGRLEFAERVQARLAGLPARIERNRIGRSETYRVAIGPFASVAQADMALDRAIQGGVTDARIVVE